MSCTAAYLADQKLGWFKWAIYLLPLILSRNEQRY